jgi:hypothetical protein
LAIRFDDLIGATSQIVIDFSFCVNTELGAQIYFGSFKRILTYATMPHKIFKVPVVPGIFAIKGSDVQMLQATGVEQIQQAFDSSEQF